MVAAKAGGLAAAKVVERAVAVARLVEGAKGAGRATAVEAAF
jgi:hypothetical protein